MCSVEGISGLQAWEEVKAVGSYVSARLQGIEKALHQITKAVQVVVAAQARTGRRRLTYRRQQIGVDRDNRRGDNSQILGSSNWAAHVIAIQRRSLKKRRLGRWRP